VVARSAPRISSRTRPTSGIILRGMAETVRVCDAREKGVALSLCIEVDGGGGGACNGGVMGKGVVGPSDTGIADVDGRSVG
jgi:hypothetical protein